MSRRILVVEPDAAGRAILDLLLTNEGYAPCPVRSIEEARSELDRGAFEIALVDERAGAGSPLEEVRRLRRDYPGLAVVVTGAVLTSRVMLELIRLGAADALPKPFTPGEVRASLARVVAERSLEHEQSVEFAAAIEGARRGLAAGELAPARCAIARAMAVAPLDAEAMALAALTAELAGDDDGAAAGYRAALALRQGEEFVLPDPYEALARLDAYGAARPVVALDAPWTRAPVRLVASPAGLPSVRAGELVVLALSIVARDEAAIHFRVAPDRAFALLSGPLRPAGLVRLLRNLHPAAIVADDATRLQLDVREVESMLAPEAAS